jgi:hypothetical protein
VLGVEVAQRDECLGEIVWLDVIPLELDTTVLPFAEQCGQLSRRDHRRKPTSRPVAGTARASALVYESGLVRPLGD